MLLVNGHNEERPIIPQPQCGRCQRAGTGQATLEVIGTGSKQSYVVRSLRTTWCKPSNDDDDDDDDDELLMYRENHSKPTRYHSFTDDTDHIGLSVFRSGTDPISLLILLLLFLLGRLFKNAKLDRIEVWQYSSSSKFALIDRV